MPHDLYFWAHLYICCPGFVWNRVNFHKKPIGPNKQDIPCHVTSRSVFKWGSWLEQGDLLLRSKLSIGRWEKCTLHILFISIIVVVFFSLCVWLNHFYLSLRVLPFPSDSPPHRTRGREEWENNCVVLCCQLGLNHDICIVKC